MTRPPTKFQRRPRASGTRGSASNKPDKARTARVRPSVPASVRTEENRLAGTPPSARRQSEFWRNVPIPKSRDIRLLRPSTLPRGQRFETRADAARIDALNVARLIKWRPDLAAEIERREEEGAFASSPISARDARRYRRYDTAERLGIAHAYEGPHEIATIYLRAFLAGRLHAADLKLAQAALRKTLQRTGFKGSILVGGTEVAWLARHDRWILHCHLLAVGVPGDAWDRLRKALPDAGAADALKVQALEDFPEQLSYCQKFNSSHKPGKRGPNGSAAAYPLPSERLIEWAEWVAKYRFEDFGLLYGARRHRGRIVPIA